MRPQHEAEGSDGVVAGSISPLHYELHLPEGAAGALVVVVHGARSHASRCFGLMQPFAAARRRALVAPAFATPAYAGFQRLEAAGTPLGAAVAFHAVVRDITTRLGRTGQPIDLIGISGGAQFAHRYALLAPERVRRLVLCAPGWYTMLDCARPFPEGVGRSVASGGRPIAIDDFLAIPTLIAIGERDVHRGPTLRIGPEIDAVQGEHRLSRAIRWHEHVETVARRHGVPSRTQLALLPATGHSFRDAVTAGGLGELAMTFFSDPATPPTEIEVPM